MPAGNCSTPRLRVTSLEIKQQMVPTLKSPVEVWEETWHLSTAPRRTLSSFVSKMSCSILFVTEYVNSTAVVRPAAGFAFWIGTYRTGPTTADWANHDGTAVRSWSAQYNDLL